MDLPNPFAEKSDIMTVGRSTVDQLDDMVQADLMQTVRLLGGAMIGLAIITAVLTEVFTLSALDISSGPFSGIIGSIESTGAAALGLLVIGLLVIAANAVMQFFGGTGF
jgi:uncharacterized membrane protein